MRTGCTFVVVVVSLIFAGITANAELCSERRISQVLHATLTIRDQIETSFDQVQPDRPYPNVIENFFIPELKISGIDIKSELIDEEREPFLLPNEVANDMKSLMRPVLFQYDMDIAKILYKELFKVSQTRNKFFVGERDEIEGFLQKFQKAWDEAPGAPITKRGSVMGKNHFVDLLRSLVDDGRYLTNCEHEQLQRLMSSGFGVNLKQSCVNNPNDPQYSRPECGLRFPRFARFSDAEMLEIKESNFGTIDLPRVGVTDLKVRQRHKLYINDEHIVSFNGNTHFMTKLFQVLTDDLF